MAHDTEHPSNENFGFDKVCSLMCEDTIPFHMYRSVSSGITVCIVELDGPIITGYFNIVTETRNDNGVPSALQHLILSGTKEHPTKATLNQWANRCLGGNIDGYCLKDRTYFTMNAAGSEAFLSLMPKYLDYIFFPSLEASAYRREIHHFDNDKNTGVLYCKQQKKEQTSSEIMTRKMFQALYLYRCKYKYVVEGTTKNLRGSTTLEKVKQFHKRFYSLNNLSILILGKIEHCKIFQALLPLEKLSSTESKQLRRPWQTPIKQLTKSVHVEVDIPCSEETYGEVYFAWRGPSVVTEMYKYRGCELLLLYIMQSFNDQLIPSMDGSYAIKCDSFIYSVSTLRMCFLKVLAENINLIQQYLKNIISNLCENGINIETMKKLIDKNILERQIKLEKNPHDLIAQSVFDHMVYGNTDNAECESNDLEERLRTIRQLENLKTESVEYFLDLLKTYFFDVPMIVVKGKPSLDEYNKVQREKIYIDKHIVPESIPTEILTSVPIPGIDSITFYQIENYTTETVEQHPKLDLKQLPFFTCLNDINTNFIYLYVLVDTSSISYKYRKYIPLLLEVIKESMKERTDVVNYNVDTGSNNPHSITLMFQVELQNYEKSIQLYKELLYDTELTADKLTLLITEVTNNLKQKTEKDITLLTAIMLMVLYKPDNYPYPSNIYELYTVLNSIRDRLNTAEQEKVLKEIECVRKTMFSPQNMFVYMAVNVDKLTEHVPDVYAPWNKFFPKFMTSKKTRPNVTVNWELLQPFNEGTDNAVIYLIENVYSFFLQVCPCIHDFYDLDLPALIVCLHYFTQMEGPLWKVMKAKECSCDFNIFANPSTGLLYLQFLKCTDIAAAYTTTKVIVETHITEAKWDQHLYDSAKSLAILKYVNEVKSIYNAIDVSFEYYCKNMPPDYNFVMVQRISAVTMDDMSRVAASYVKSLFDPKSVKTAIVCNKFKFDEILTAFDGMKYKFHRIEFILS